MKVSFKFFSELTTKELYQILQLRSEIFVVEQNCVYQDIDGKDEKAIHIIGVVQNKIVALLVVLSQVSILKKLQ